VSSVVIADDHPAALAGLRAILESGGFAVAAAVETGGAAVDAALRVRPDLCVLDVHMPDGGIAAAAQISSALPDTHIVMLTASFDEDELIDSVRAGANGYLLKDMNPERFVPAMRGVLAGEAAIPRALVSRIVSDMRHGGKRRVTLPDGRAEGLTDREHDVLWLLGQGRATQHIAHELGISAVTARRHISTLIAKLGVGDREAAAALARGATGRR